MEGISERQSRLNLYFVLKIQCRVVCASQATAESALTDT